MLRYRLPLLLLFTFFFVAGLHAKSNPDEVAAAYIEKWIDFYPSEAFSYGLKTAAQHFEDLSPARVTTWLQYNRDIIGMLAEADDNWSRDQAIDARVLLRQAKLELERWQYDKALVNQPIYYAEIISQALTYILVREELSHAEKRSATLQRLRGIQTLCASAVRQLVNGSPQRTRRAVQILQRSAGFYADKLTSVTRDWGTQAEHEELVNVANATVKAVNALIAHIENTVLPQASIADKFDGKDYARKLAVHVDTDMTPQQLSDIALQEINEVRRLMLSEAKAWWQLENADVPMPATEAGLLQATMLVMENERMDNREDFLHFFTRLTDEAEAFVIAHKLASVPLPRTLYIGLSPDHFSGAAYGGVYPTGPFNPEANTLFYLPTIPDDSPAEEKTGFYRSFNNHFNTMIIAHEMLPGHYMQYKIAVTRAPALRSLFANAVYVEGWGSFSEELMLNAGWGKGNKLTRLAHLRKRLENATRAYTSVMVHSEGWEQQQVLDFAVERGLLAPQFATNLWNRVMNSPLQIPSYFLGFHGFRNLWQQQQNRLGDKFNTADFVDRVLQAGPIPIDALLLDAE